ncbi:motility accessory factor [Campylobacter lari]|nr:motility accessory factor [Campylobacter lari]EFO9447687.1 motility accessory factor [Campylobacter lari]
MQKHIFNKNLKALNNIKLKETLKKIKILNFKTIQGKDPLDINFIHNGGGIHYITTLLTN